MRSFKALACLTFMVYVITYVNPRAAPFYGCCLRFFWRRLRIRRQGRNNVAETKQQENQAVTLPSHAIDGLQNVLGERFTMSRGGVCAEHAIERGKIHCLQSEPGEAVNMMRQIKNALDPNNIINPGKVCGWTLTKRTMKSFE